MTASLEIAAKAVAGWLKEAGRPLVVGICGAQGSGKSALATRLEAHFNAKGVATCILSLDDFYLPREKRPVDVHPLFATRGVPGTHDVAAIMAVIDALARNEPALVPRFDKAADAPLPEHEWRREARPVDLVLVEGWCIGARPQGEDALGQPVNDLERDSDGEGLWRRHVNDALRGDYAALFGRLDKLILLAAPGFDIVRTWRGQQENGLRNRLRREGREGTHVMSEAGIAAFIQHYQRLTVHILHEMPGRADLVISLDRYRRPRSVKRR